MLVTYCFLHCLFVCLCIAETEQGVAQAIIRSVVDFKRDPWPKVSDSAKDLVKKMLNPDPKLRLTAQEVFDHPWLQNAKKAPNVSLGETVRARLKQFSVMNKLKKRALRVINFNIYISLKRHITSLLCSFVLILCIKTAGDC